MTGPYNLYCFARQTGEHLWTMDCAALRGAPHYEWSKLSTRKTSPSALSVTTLTLRPAVTRHKFAFGHLFFDLATQALCGFDQGFLFILPLANRKDSHQKSFTFAAVDRYLYGKMEVARNQSLDSPGARVCDGFLVYVLERTIILFDLRAIIRYVSGDDTAEPGRAACASVWDLHNLRCTSSIVTRRDSLALASSRLIVIDAKRAASDTDGRKMKPGMINLEFHHLTG